MKQILSLNQGWMFYKDCKDPASRAQMQGVVVDLPHTWNAFDGQDGGGDYWRGTCCYARPIGRYPGRKVYIEVEAAASSAILYVNGREITSHDGGYSAFRADITESLTEDENWLMILTDNSANDRVYPQTADFTFYGGLYRGVSLILTDESHFDLDFFGSNGLAFSSRIEGEAAIVGLHAWITNPQPFQTVLFTICDREGRSVAEAACQAQDHVSADVRIGHAHLWDGVRNPYLYTVTARLCSHNEVIDETADELGIRTFHVDSQKGFYLNGKLTPLRGVSRHQDWLGAGNALTKEQHEQDIRLILEVGANTVRLAHYQHSREFYRACDRAGLIVWAEIPFISVMSVNPEAHLNCISQMKELIAQNYNHPSICFWGIANEITIGGERAGLKENLEELNRLVHEMDPTRLSTIAQVSMLPMDSPLNRITDLVSYNHYFGWYVPGLEKNEQWLDAFHEKYPQIPLGLSEYGAEGILTYHSDDPKCKDYSEDYQAFYHEHMARIIMERPWLWATHVWNMFDFGCDARDEGGVRGRNNKGLVTFDRKIRKDSFYLYKAYWSQEPFVHLCQKRYAGRTGETADIKVYSNQPRVSLYVNGKLHASMEGEKVFRFTGIPLSECTMVTALAGELEDSMTICKAAEPVREYILEEEDDGSEGAANWFDPADYQHVSTLEIREGFYSVKDTIGEIMEKEEAGNVLVQAVGKATGMKLKKSMLGMVKDMTLEEMGAMAGIGENPQLLIAINEVLNKIPKN